MYDKIDKTDSKDFYIIVDYKFKTVVQKLNTAHNGYLIHNKVKNTYILAGKHWHNQAYLDKNSAMLALKPHVISRIKSLKINAKIFMELSKKYEKASNTITK